MEEQCIGPEQLEEQQIADYVDNAASVAIQDHIAQCPACQLKVIRLKEELALLYAAAYDYDCPDSEEILGYQAGLLDAEAEKRIEQHVESCANCRQYLQQLLDVPLTPSIPVWLTGNLWDRLRDTGKRLFKSVQMPTPGGSQPALVFRGGERIRETYEAGDYQIGLVKIMPIANENRWQLEGQIANMVNSAAMLHGRVDLQINDKIIASETIDEFGYFAIQEVPPGNYIILLELETGFIPIPDFPIP